MKKTAFVLVLVLSCFGLFFRGIMRHDISESAYEALANQPQFDCAGQVLGKDSSGIGSCVLIGEKYVLSAAHVFYEADITPLKKTINGKEATLYISSNPRPGTPENYSFKFGNKHYKAKSFTFHPNYTDSTGSYDLVVIELKERVPGVKPAKINTSRNELHARVVGVGYGASGIANKPETVTNLQKRIAGENTIDTIKGFKDSKTGEYTELLADFDSPVACKSCNKSGSAKPLPLEYIPSGGDSGSGLFRQQNEDWELIGICTGYGVNIKQLMKTGYYGQTASWTRTSLFADWIAQNSK